MMPFWHQMSAAVLGSAPRLVAIKKVQRNPTAADPRSRAGSPRARVKNGCSRCNGALGISLRIEPKEDANHLRPLSPFFIDIEDPGIDHEVLAVVVGQTRALGHKQAMAEADQNMPVRLHELVLFAERLEYSAGGYPSPYATLV